MNYIFDPIIVAPVAICPVCNGTGRIPADTKRDYKYIAGYNEETHTLPCRNCGGQTMAVKGTGKVPLNGYGIPCTHEYKYRLAGNCYHEYTCRHCNHRYYIDSGD